MNITTAEILDEETIKEFLTPDLLDQLVDDTEIKEVRPVCGLPGLKYLGVYVDDRLVGIVMVQRRNHIMWEIHPAYAPDVWGTDVTRATAPAMLDGIFELTGAKKLYANVPCTYKATVAYAKRIGLKIEGTCKRSWQKNGEIVDTYHMGVYR